MEFCGRFRITTQRIAACLAILVLLASGGISPVRAETPLDEPVLGERILKMGSWGADVFHLQQYLIRLGHSIAADGLYGSETRRAILSFQLTHNLKADGIVGPETLARIRQQLEAQSESFIVYEVQPGDSLWTLARRFDTTMELIVDRNNLQTSLLRVGQELYIPAPRTYQVQPGDTLSQIALRFDTTVQQLIELNDIQNPNVLRDGITLRLPRPNR